MLRISTHLGQNPDLQLDALKDIAKNKGWEVIGEYVDVISGSKSSKQRPQLNNLMKDAFQRRFDCVMVYALDRLARSIEHFINITNELTALNINLFSMREYRLVYTNWSCICEYGVSYCSVGEGNNF